MEKVSTIAVDYAKPFVLWADKEKETTENVKPRNGKYFEMEEMYELLGCELIEILYLPNGYLMILDEEGKLKDGCVLNMSATCLAALNGAIAQDDLVVGNVLVCKNKYIR